jgi:hypothetical protein
MILSSCRYPPVARSWSVESAIVAGRAIGTPHHCRHSRGDKAEIVPCSASKDRTRTARPPCLRKVARIQRLVSALVPRALHNPEKSRMPPEVLVEDEQPSMKIASP